MTITFCIQNPAHKAITSPGHAQRCKRGCVVSIRQKAPWYGTIDDHDENEDNDDEEGEEYNVPKSAKILRGGIKKVCFLLSIWGGWMGSQFLSRTSFDFWRILLNPFLGKWVACSFSFLRVCTCASVPRPCATRTSSLREIRSLRPMQKHPQQIQVQNQQKIQKQMQIQLREIRSLQPLQTHRQQIQGSGSIFVFDSIKAFIETGNVFVLKVTMLFSGGWWDSTTAAQGGADSVQPSVFILLPLSLLFYSLF